MNSAEFEAKLKEAGYCEIATKTMDPRPANGEHGHEFSVRGLVTAGAFVQLFAAGQGRRSARPATDREQVHANRGTRCLRFARRLARFVSRVLVLRCDAGNWKCAQRATSQKCRVM